MCIYLVTLGVTLSTQMTNVRQSFHTSTVDEMCKLLAPGVESQTAIHQLEVFPVFIDLITMKLNF